MSDDLIPKEPTGSSMSIHPEDFADAGDAEPSAPLGFQNVEDRIATDLFNVTQSLIALREHRERINDEIAELVETQIALQQSMGAFERRRKHLDERHVAGA